MGAGLLGKSTSWLPMEWVRPLSGVALVVPYYHMVSDARVPHVSQLYGFRSVAEFTADVEYFARNFTPVTLAEIVEALNGTRELPRSCFHLTFDDGFSEMHDVVAPILERAGVSATFFLTTAFLDGGGLAHHNELSLILEQLATQPVSDAAKERLESLLPAQGSNLALRDRVLSLRYAQKAVVRSAAEVLELDIGQYVIAKQPHLTSQQVAALIGRGFSIGAHSYDHPLYADLSPAEQLAQTRTSVELLVKRFGIHPRSFAFPHNDSGVGDAFFATIFGEGLLDVSFGTSGLVAHAHRRNIERVKMEDTTAPAGQILARQFARATYFRLRRGERAPVPA